MAPTKSRAVNSGRLLAQVGSQTHIDYVAVTVEDGFSQTAISEAFPLLILMDRRPRPTRSAMAGQKETCPPSIRTKDVGIWTTGELGIFATRPVRRRDYSTQVPTYVSPSIVFETNFKVPNPPASVPPLRFVIPRLGMRQSEVEIPKILDTEKLKREVKKAPLKTVKPQEDVKTSQLKTLSEPEVTNQIKNGGVGDEKKKQVKNDEGSDESEGQGSGGDPTKKKGHPETGKGNEGGEKKTLSMSEILKLKEEEEANLNELKAEAEKLKDQLEMEKLKDQLEAIKAQQELEMAKLKEEFEAEKMKQKLEVECLQKQLEAEKLKKVTGVGSIYEDKEDAVLQKMEAELEKIKAMRVEKEKKIKGEFTKDNGMEKPNPEVIDPGKDDSSKDDPAEKGDGEGNHERGTGRTGPPPNPTSGNYFNPNAPTFIPGYSVPIHDYTGFPGTDEGRQLHVVYRVPAPGTQTWYCPPIQINYMDSSQSVPPPTFATPCPFTPPQFPTYPPYYR